MQPRGRRTRGAGSECALGSPSQPRMTDPRREELVFSAPVSPLGNSGRAASPHRERAARLGGQETSLSLSPARTLFGLPFLRKNDKKGPLFGAARHGSPSSFSGRTSCWNGRSEIEPVRAVSPGESSARGSFFALYSGQSDTSLGEFACSRFSGPRCRTCVSDKRPGRKKRAEKATPPT